MNDQHFNFAHRYIATGNTRLPDVRTRVCAISNAANVEDQLCDERESAATGVPTQRESHMRLLTSVSTLRIRTLEERRILESVSSLLSRSPPCMCWGCS